MARCVFRNEIQSTKTNNPPPHTLTSLSSKDVFYLYFLLLGIGGKERRGRIAQPTEKSEEKSLEEVNEL